MKRGKDTQEERCRWCHRPAAQGWCSPLVGVWGAVERVCGPSCPSRPVGVEVGPHPTPTTKRRTG